MCDPAVSRRGPRTASREPRAANQAPWHFLYFFPLPHEQGSLRPTFGSSRFTCRTTSSPPVRAGRGGSPPPRGGAAGAPPPMAPNGEDCCDEGELSVIGAGRRGGGRGAGT